MSPPHAETAAGLTLLVGGLPRLHERLGVAVLEAEGQRCQVLPTPDLRDCQCGKENSSPGLCNPVYFTIGNLIMHLRSLEASGLSHAQIVERYAYVSAGSCGPCRFGMYESLYRQALASAGFEGFRILLIRQQNGLLAGEGEGGLHFSEAFLPRLFYAFMLADILNEMHHRLHPYALNSETAEARFEQATRTLCATLREIGAPPRGRRSVFVHEVFSLFYGRKHGKALAQARKLIDSIELDPLRLKPLVKITGEFWAQSTEGDGNHRIFEFLEQEGAEILVDPLSGWILYLLDQARYFREQRWPIDRPCKDARWWQPWRVAWNALARQRRLFPFHLGLRAYTHLYRRVARRLGGVASPLVPQDELAQLSAPYLDRRARGGEGHLEVGKSLYYTRHHLAQMILSLKPFGCLPSTQSDGVLSTVASHTPAMIFLPVETSPEGAIHARSRVQMALGEARMAAREELARALAATGRTLDELRRFTLANTDLCRLGHALPRRKGFASTAASAVFHIDELMRGSQRRPAAPHGKMPASAGERHSGSVAQVQD